MVSYMTCANCGTLSDDGSNVNGEWLCPECFGKDDEGFCCSYCGGKVDRFAAGGGKDARCCCADPACVEKFEREEEFIRDMIKREAEEE